MPNFLTKKFQGNIFVKLFHSHNSSEMHSHEYIELAYVLEGDGITNINGKTEPFKKGDFYIIDYNSSHSYYSDKMDFKIINCLFSPKIIDSSFADGMSFNDAMVAYFFKISGRHLNYTPADRLFHDETGEIKTLFENIFNEYLNDEAGNMALLRYYIRTVIIKLARIIGSTNKVSDAVKQTIDVIEKKCNENISFGDIAEELHYSLPYLSAKFKKETGMTFTKYIKNVRVEKAASLLTDTNIPIKEIAEQVGYTDLNTFYSVFKQVMNVTPKEYRKKVIKKTFD